MKAADLPVFHVLGATTSCFTQSRLFMGLFLNDCMLKQYIEYLVWVLGLFIWQCRCTLYLSSFHHVIRDHHLPRSRVRDESPLVRNSSTD